MDESTRRDVEELHGFGYAQQLLRDVGGFENFALSFSIISVLTGAITLYGYGLNQGGPYVMTVGWPLVTIFTLCVAASLAEIASSIPTAGAMYHWASFIGSRGWGWAAGWFNVIGQYAITAGIDFGCAQFATPLLGLEPSHGNTLAVFAVILLSHGLLNHYGIRLVARANWFSAIYHMAVVALVVGALALLAPKREVSFLFETGFTTQQGVPWLWAFALGLLQAQWTYTGYDASAHISEETRLPRVNAPWGIFLSVAISSLFGYLLLLAVTITIRDLAQAAATDNPFTYIVAQALGERLGNAVVWAVTAAMWFCGLSSVTSNARMVYAFSRDGGMPGSVWWGHIHPRWRTPTAATWNAVIIAFLIALYSKAYSVIVSLSTIGLYLAYAIPIYLRWRERRRGSWKAEYDGPWSLGRYSNTVSLIALIWIAVICVLFVAPPNETTGYTMATFTALLLICWHALGVKKKFAGPRRLGTEQELYEMENQIERTSAWH